MEDIGSKTLWHCYVRNVHLNEICVVISAHSLLHSHSMAPHSVDYLRDVTTTHVNSASHPFGVAKSSTSFGWGKSGKVTSAGWQVTLCVPIWYAISSNGKVKFPNCLHPSFSTWQLHICTVANSVHFIFLVDLAKLAITIADFDRFYWNLVICLHLDVTLSMENLVKTWHYLQELWKCIHGITFFPGRTEEQPYDNSLSISLTLILTWNLTLQICYACCIFALVTRHWHQDRKRISVRVWSH